MGRNESPLGVAFEHCVVATTVGLFNRNALLENYNDKPMVWIGSAGRRDFLGLAGVLVGSCL